MEQRAATGLIIAGPDGAVVDTAEEDGMKK
jgi:hypothetical protein